MVEKQRPRSGSRFSLNPLTAATLDAIPPLGYKRPPPLIGFTTVTTAHRLLRAKNYALAYKSTTIKDWNMYIAFGIQQFDSPAKYFAQCDAETLDEKHLRLARYYRLHLENNTQVERPLMQKITMIETALNASYPGYFEMSVGEMDEYVRQLSPDPMELESQISSVDPTNNILLDAQLGTLSLPTPLQVCASAHDKSLELSNGDSMDIAPLTQAPSSPSVQSEHAARSVTSPLKTGISCLVPKVIPPSSEAIQKANAYIQASAKEQISKTALLHTDELPKPPSPTNTATEKAAKISPKEKSIIQVEVRWAPKDFTTLKASKAQMYTRFAPILSSFNTTHSWVVEWQTDQRAKDKTIESTQVDQFLSIRCVTSTKQKCFYFSFRVHATGSQFIQVLKSKELQNIKRGESISFDPSSIPQIHSEVTHIGDILLKDATSTHRGQYLAYLHSEVLPPNMPAFDLKVKHKDPSGVKIQILTVRCGKQVATQVAQILCSVLNGEGTNPEIFISRLALGANRITRGDHDRIYQVHRDFMADIEHIPFLSGKQIDLSIVEYLDNGEQLSRSPRQWAKSLCDGEGNSLEVDMENGLPDGDVVLIVPSVALEQAQLELHKYWQRQNPTIMKAERFYSASVLDDPDIPLTVFTQNIDKILAKKIKKHTQTTGLGSVRSPASSITGQTSRTSKTSVAWQVPLQQAPVSTSQSKQGLATTTATHDANKVQSPASLREREQQKRISMLEAQLASMSAGNSRNSGDKSQLSGNSPNSLATAHARLDGIETTVLNIQALLQTMTAASTHSQQSPTDDQMDEEWPSMPRKQLFSDHADPGNHHLAILGSASPAVSRKGSKRRKAINSPTDLIPQYNDQMDSGSSSSF